MRAGLSKPIDGFGVGAGGFREAKDGTTGIGHDPRCVGRIVDEARGFAAELGVEFAGEVARFQFRGCNILPLRQLFKRSGAEAIEKLGIELANLRHHFADDGAGFAGRVRGGAHAPEAVKDDTGDGVHHGGESGDR